MGYLGIMLIMRYHDDGGALVVHLSKQMHYLGSVSYTHLDVYKRQPYKRAWLPQKKAQKPEK